MDVEIESVASVFELRITSRVNAWQVNDVSIERVGTRLVELESAKNVGVRVRIICETSILNDEKRVGLRL